MLFSFGPFALDTGSRRLVRDSEYVHLTPKAFDLLTLVVSEAPRVTSKDELHQRLWPDRYVSEATLASLVKELRRALDNCDAQPSIIRTVHSVGYAFCLEVTRGERSSSGPWHWLVIGSRRVLLQQGRNLIGREVSADVRMDSPSVSRRHASVVIGREGARLEDERSKNGTRVGEQTVTESTLLHDGDRIHFGDVLGIYRTSTTGASTETHVGTLPSKRRMDRIEREA